MLGCVVLGAMALLMVGIDYGLLLSQKLWLNDLTKFKER